MNLVCTWPKALQHVSINLTLVHGYNDLWQYTSSVIVRANLRETLPQPKIDFRPKLQAFSGCIWPKALPHVSITHIWVYGYNHLWQYRSSVIERANFRERLPRPKIDFRPKLQAYLGCIWPKALPHVSITHIRVYGYNHLWQYKSSVTERANIRERLPLPKIDFRPKLQAFSGCIWP